MVNNSNDINKRNNYLSSQLTEHKKKQHNICHWKSHALVWDRHKNVARLTIDAIDSPKKEPPKKVSGRGDAKVKVKEEVDDEPTTSKSSGKGKAAKKGGKKGKSGKEENDTEEKEVGKGFFLM
jgi:hypothetical protein